MYLFIFNRYHQTLYKSVCVNIYSYQYYMIVLVGSHWFCFPITLKCMQWCQVVVLICIYLKTNEIAEFFRYLLAIWISSFIKLSIQVFCAFLSIELSVFLLICGSLYVYNEFFEGCICC